MTRSAGAARLGALLAATAFASCRELAPRQADEVDAGSSSGAVSSSGGSSSSSSGSSSGGSSGASGSSSSGSSSGAPPPFDAGPVLSAGDHTLGPDDRPAILTVPAGYVGQPLPILVLLHGTAESPDSIEEYVRMKPVAEALGFFLLRARGEPNLFGYAAWNATDSCCSYQSSPPDDSAYLNGLVDYAAAAVAIDAARVFAVGHSSGGFMAYRLACDHADRFAGIVSFAGATYLDAADCAPSAGVHVLQIHGDQDTTVRYGGGSFGIYGSYPGAERSVSTWAAYNGCAPTLVAGGARDLLAAAGADDSDTGAHAQCPAGASAELWTLRGADHVPALSSSFATQVAEWLLARPKP